MLILLKYYYFYFSNYNIVEKIIRFIFIFCSCCFFNNISNAQGFNRQDTLRGSITPERAWWDVMRYDIQVTPDFDTKTISGNVSITVKITGQNNTMQIDLQAPLEIDSIILQQNQKIPFTKDGNAWFLKMPSLAVNSTQKVKIFYHGKPREAIRPPWDGGWIWKKDEQGNPWMSVACQGLGASVWYPCKDHQSDEPDQGASISMTVPDTLVAVANGRKTAEVKSNDGKVTYTWNVINPINNYNIIPYIGKYVNWTETFNGEKGKLDCSYWVLNYNLVKAKEQFKQAPLMLKCFEEWFGPYPFYEDGYKLIESPHLGMEHQSAVAYGNKFENGYLGTDLSATGWGLKWDFIIVHESGHEWFANNITSKDIADMWIHEGFTNYSETVFTMCQYGKEAGNDYLIGSRKRIKNAATIIGQYGVNKGGSGDMYYKGGSMIHTIRQVINNDDTFKKILRGLNKTFYHQTVTTAQVENYISKESGIDFSKVFDQYLRNIQIPVLEYKINGSAISYRWTNCIGGFNLPVKVKLGEGNEVWLKATDQWQSLQAQSNWDKKTFVVDRNFYVESKQGE